MRRLYPHLKCCSFEVATLLHELQIDYFSQFMGKYVNYYNHDGVLNGDVALYLKSLANKKTNNKYKSIFAPPIALVVEWLCDNYNIHISKHVDTYDGKVKMTAYQWDGIHEPNLLSCYSKFDISDASLILNRILHEVITKLFKAQWNPTPIFGV